MTACSASSTPDSGPGRARPHFWCNHLSPFTCVCCFVLLNPYCGIVTVPCDRVCCFVLLNLCWGIVMYGHGASSWASQGRRTHDPRSTTSQPHPVPPQITWGGFGFGFGLLCRHTASNSRVSGSSPSALTSYTVTKCVCCFVLLCVCVCVALFCWPDIGESNGPGSFLKSGDLGLPDPHPSP